MRKLSLVLFALGMLFLTACSKSGSSNPTAVANCSTNGVYNPNGTAYPYGSQYPYGVPGTTGCAGLPGGIPGAYTGAGYGYGGSQYGNPCAIYNTGYQTWTVTMYGGQAVCISNF